MSDLDFESPRRFRASFISGSSAVYFSIFFFFRIYRLQIFLFASLHSRWWWWWWWWWCQYYFRKGPHESLLFLKLNYGCQEIVDFEWPSISEISCYSCKFLIYLSFYLSRFAYWSKTVSFLTYELYLSCQKKAEKDVRDMQEWPSFVTAILCGRIVTLN